MFHFHRWSGRLREVRRARIREALSPDEWRYGLDVMRATRLHFGSFTPLVDSMIEAGEVERMWEADDFLADLSEKGPPRRMMYRLKNDSATGG